MGIVCHPFLGDLAAIGYDADALEMQLFLAVAQNIGEELGIQERFSAYDVELAHACIFKEFQALLCSFGGFDV